MSSTMEERGAQSGLKSTSRQAPFKDSDAVTSLPTADATASSLACVSVPPCRVTSAKPGDHHSAAQLLASLQQAPSIAEFQAQLDDPYYEPTDRLLCHVGPKLVGHARIIKREMQFGSTVMPVASVADYVVLPEFRENGLGSELLRVAEREMAADGAWLGLVRTSQPQFFLRRGWTVWTRHSYSVASAREILAKLLDEQSGREKDLNRPLSIRLWRHIELAGLVRLYSQATRHAFGPVVRSEAYWQWLVARRAFDRIYVAMDGTEPPEFDRAASAIVGYAVMRDGRILELVTSPDHPHAAEKLLARACSDVIELNGNYVRLDAPVDDPLHGIFARAHGERAYHEAVQGEVCLLKMLDLDRVFEALAGTIHERAKAASISLPCELGFEIDDAKYVIEIRSRCVRLRTLTRNARSGSWLRNHLKLTRSEFVQLLMGHLDLPLTLSSGRIKASTRIAAQTATAILPALSTWRPPWDDLAAR